MNRYVDRRDLRQLIRLFWSEAGKQPPVRKRDGRNAVLLLRFMLSTVARLGEACRLRWDHVNRRTGVIEFPVGEHKTGEETGE